jgi:hypothetical protein
MPKVKKLKPIDTLKGVKSLRRLFSTERRWIKGDYITNDNTQVCLVGGVETIYSGNKEAEVKQKLKKSISNFYKMRCGQAKKKDIEEFNDSRTRKFSDIRWVIEDAKV